MCSTQQLVCQHPHCPIQWSTSVCQGICRLVSYTCIRCTYAHAYMDVHLFSTNTHTHTHTHTHTYTCTRAITYTQKKSGLWCTSSFSFYTLVHIHPNNCTQIFCAVQVPSADVHVPGLSSCEPCGDGKGHTSS